MKQQLVYLVAELSDEDRLARARKLLEEAIARSKAEKEPSTSIPGSGGLRGVPGMRVDKYFGTELPPVCARLGCFVTDDGKRYYCVNPSCQKHKLRETKHTRKGRPEKARFAYFRCPRCNSRNIEMHVLANVYACRACKHSWKR